MVASADLDAWCVGFKRHGLRSSTELYGDRVRVSYSQGLIAIKDGPWTMGLRTARRDGRRLTDETSRRVRLSSQRRRLSRERQVAQRSLGRRKHQKGQKGNSVASHTDRWWPRSRPTLVQGHVSLSRMTRCLLRRPDAGDGACHKKRTIREAWDVRCACQGCRLWRHACADSGKGVTAAGDRLAPRWLGDWRGVRAVVRSRSLW